MHFKALLWQRPYYTIKSHFGTILAIIEQPNLQTTVSNEFHRTKGKPSYQPPPRAPSTGGQNDVTK
jgi:hypothetical protein